MSAVPQFDLSDTSTPGYFKSSFARSMATESKSLEVTTVRDHEYSSSVAHENDEDDDSMAVSDGMTPPVNSTCIGGGGRRFVNRLDNNSDQVRPAPRRSVPSLPTYESVVRESFRRSRNTDVLQFWKMKQENAGKASAAGGCTSSLWSTANGNCADDGNKSNQTNGTASGTWSSPPSPVTSDESKDDEILRLRKECQLLMETNRRLQQSGSSTCLPVDVSVLQSQIDTLQWQLKQAESNRQMYRAVMDQVSKFLERVHRTLELVPSMQSCNGGGVSKTGPRAKHRVPRSRSVHTVVSGSGTAPHSRASSPSAISSASVASSATTGSSVHRANSISQISHETSSYLTWRSGRSSSSGGAMEDAGNNLASGIVPLDRLSQEAFRLLRTVQSLLCTREPDLARLASDSSDLHTDSTSMGSCSSLLDKAAGSNGSSSTAPVSSSSAHVCNGEIVSVHQGVAANSAVNGMESSDGATNSAGLSTPQLSVGSAEDESGFSSMSSFHDQPTGGALHQSTKPPSHHLHHNKVYSSSGKYSSHSTSIIDSSNGPSSLIIPASHETSNGGIMNGTDKTKDDNSLLSVNHHYHHPQRRGSSSVVLSSASFQSPSQQSTAWDPRRASNADSPSHRANELGLPLVDPASFRHRRWSSVPVPDRTAAPALTVLWPSSPLRRRDCLLTQHQHKMANYS